MSASQVESVQPAAAAEPSSARLIFTLTFAGLVSGLVLVGVYEATLPRITANQAKALRKAVYQVVPGATQMQKLVPDGSKLVVAGAAAEGEAIYAAYDKAGNFVGYAIAAEGSGFADTIKLIYGYDPRAKKTLGMQVLESRETPGLGDKIYKSAKFVANFKGLSVEPEVVVTKRGRSKPNEVDAITGATISSKAVVKIINEGNKLWFGRLPAPGSEPRLPAGGGTAGAAPPNATKGEER